MTLEIGLVLALLAAAIMLFALEWLSVDVVTLLLLLALIVSRTLTPQEAFSGFANDIIIVLCSIFVLSKALLETGRLVVLIGGMTSVGLALEKTGAAGFMAGFLVERATPLGPIGLLAAFGVATIVLAQPMSNAAAALVMLPVAVTTAEQIGADPRSFAVMVALRLGVLRDPLRAVQHPGLQRRQVPLPRLRAGGTAADAARPGDPAAAGALLLALVSRALKAAMLLSNLNRGTLGTRIEPGVQPMSEAKIISDPDIAMGKPVVAGTRITVEHILVFEKHAQQIAGNFTVVTPNALRIRTRLRQI